MKRRHFLAAQVLAGLAAPTASAAGPPPIVSATGDGIPHTPAEYAGLLAKLAPTVAPDTYSREGAVAKLETAVAAALGKEMAVWLPTGTLANHLAVRVLARERRRVLVQQECHLYNDCGDCCQTLSGLTMIPLAPERATFTLSDVENAAGRGASGRVAVPIGALQIETPVRRRTGEMFDIAEMRKIIAWARANKTGLHLDGARLYIAASYTGIPVREYAAMFDTVYISMYKYFNAASGAVLAGPRSLLENLYHTRRMFGGGLSHVWPFAAIAQHYFDGFEQRHARAVASSERVIAALQADSRFEIRRVPNGTNIFFLRAKGVAAAAYRQRCRSAEIQLAEARPDDSFAVLVNETWNRSSTEEILSGFRKALA